MTGSLAHTCRLDLANSLESNSRACHAPMAWGLSRNDARLVSLVAQLVAVQKAHGGDSFVVVLPLSRPALHQGLLGFELLQSTPPMPRRAPPTGDF